MSISPWLALVNPRAIRKLVVFPAPFGPRKPVSRPPGISKERWSSADTGPNRFATSLKVMVSMGPGPGGWAMSLSAGERPSDRCRSETTPDAAPNLTAMSVDPASTVIAGIVLAAGEATRMGRPKQLLDLGGSPILQHAIDVAEASDVDEVVVVLGAGSEEIAGRISGQRARLVVNPDHTMGNVSSLVCGADAAPGADAFVLLMGDQPETRVAAIDQITGLWRRRRPWGAVTRYDDRIGHPFLLSRACLQSAAQVGGSKLLWTMLAEDDSGRVAAINHPGSAPADINTPDDYRELIARWGQLPR